MLDYFGEDLNDGDVFILNDPYHGGSHLPDVTILRPVFWEGSLRYMAVNRAHHSDIGGGTHGGYNPSATEIFHEGLSDFHLCASSTKARRAMTFFE